QIRDFDRDDAVLTGVETRTSSPIRLTRDAESQQSLNVHGLYPGGEGAGYAGGILSAAVDGIKLAEAVARDISGGRARHSTTSASCSSARIVSSSAASSLKVNTWCWSWKKLRRVIPRCCRRASM